MALIVTLWCAAFWATLISGYVSQWHVAVIAGFFLALFTLLAALAERRTRRRDGPWGPRP